MTALVFKIGTTLKSYHDEFSIAARIALLIVGLSVGTVALIAAAQKAAAATIRPETIITGDYIRLGDVFDGVKNAEYVLGPAPQPGKDMILNARTLYKIASALDVDWQPASPTEQVILRREAVIVSQGDISRTLENSIREKGVKEAFTIEYSSSVTDMMLPADSDATVEVSALRFDPQNDMFRATLVSPSVQNPLKRMDVTGRIERLVSVPVLKNSLKNGDVIGALDIDYMDVPRHRVAVDTILDEKDLVNLTPRRLIPGGRTIQRNELEQPRMVDRGDAITLVFANGPMTLTIKGKSLQTGAMGDMIRVSNLESNKTLQGTVTGHREVTIR